VQKAVDHGVMRQAAQGAVYGLHEVAGV